MTDDTPKTIVVTEDMVEHVSWTNERADPVGDIRRAIEAMEWAPVGTPLYLPDGTYRFDSPVTYVPASGDVFTRHFDPDTPKINDRAALTPREAAKRAAKRKAQRRARK